MLKGNLVVGKNQSVVLKANLLQELLRQAEARTPTPGSQAQVVLRLDLAQSDFRLDRILAGTQDSETSRSS